MSASDSGEAAQPLVIFNADDFGRSSSINQAVIEAHSSGLLSSASLMVGGEAAEEAVSLARAARTLAVGLHVVAAGARPVLPPQELPHLVDRRGQLPSSPVLAGIRYALSRAARRELRLEIEAQFARFRATGLALSHVDGHMHLHLHPAVLDMVLDLARKYGAGGLRLPRDDLRTSRLWGTGVTPAKVVQALFLALLCRRGRRALARRRRAGQALRVPARVYGQHESGRMTEAYVAAVLEHLEAPSVELYFHPSSGCRHEPLGPNPGDLATLLSPRVKAALAASGARRATYLDLP